MNTNPTLNHPAASACAKRLGLRLRPTGAAAFHIASRHRPDQRQPAAACLRATHRQALQNAGALLLCLCVVAAAHCPATASAQTSAFTYQGQLTDHGVPANGLFDVTFALFDASSGPAQVSGSVTNSATTVSNGLFTVMLDFGPGTFPGADRWLEIGVRTNGGGEFALLTPRQPITSAPYAIRAAQAASANAATTADSAATAGSATTAQNFTGALAGDVTGSQGATVVGSVGGQSASSVATGAAAANAATSASVPDTLVKRDASGNFSAGAITAGSVSGSGAGLTGLNASQLTTGTVGDARLSANVALQNANNILTGSNRLTGVVVATNTGNVLNGTFTGNLTGNVTGNMQGNVIGAASSATNFTGTLAGDVTGPQGATAVASVGGQSAASVAAGAAAANAAISANTPSTLVKRDAAGGFSAGAVAASSLSGDGAGVVNLNAGSLASGTVADARLSGNVPLRDGTNHFSGDNTFAGTVTATNANNTLSGTFTGNLTGNVQGNLVGAASTATNFSGALGGDVTGGQTTTVVASVGGRARRRWPAGLLRRTARRRPMLRKRS